MQNANTNKMHLQKKCLERTFVAINAYNKKMRKIPNQYNNHIH